MSLGRSLFYPFSAMRKIDLSPLQNEDVSETYVRVSVAVTVFSFFSQCVFLHNALWIIFPEHGKLIGAKYYYNCDPF